MRKLKTSAIIDLDESVGSWNTREDRWSRRAKHHISQSELANYGEDTEFCDGDRVIYEGKAATVRIPRGPRGTVGIILEGHLRMVHGSKISSEITEGVMGGVMPMPAINRMMQLAGLEHTGAVSQETVEETEISEDAAGSAVGMIGNLAKQAENMGQFKDRPEAAKLYAIGSVLSALYKSANETTFNSTEALAKKKELDALGAFGADLIKTAQNLAVKAANTQASQRATGTGTAE